MTRVRPGMLPPIMRITPNSPTVWAKPSTAPVRRPGLARGSATVKNARVVFDAFEQNEISYVPLTTKWLEMEKLLNDEITLARNYAVGAAGRLVMDSLPFTGQMTTYSLLEDAPGLPDYVPDSAATGTASIMMMIASRVRLAIM